MNQTTLPVPVFTALDATVQGIGALVYLVIGVAAWARAPRDVRTRVFLAFSIANLVVLIVPAILWLRGSTDPAALPRGAVIAMMAGLGVSPLLLFHFTQIFPRRRPWIRSAGIQMPVAYVLVPSVIAGLVWFLPRELGQIAILYVGALLVFGFPLFALLAIVLPFGAILSLIRSHRDVIRDGRDALRRPLEWILIGQIAGGSLALVFAPVLTVFAPNTLAQKVVTVAICALGLLTPLAFAVAVWKLDVLAVDPD